MKANEPQIYASLFEMIDKGSLTKTSINIFTQFPATDLENYQKLEERAIAFGVAINFYFGDEPYLVGCDFSSSNSFINQMRELAFVTGGFFVVFQGDASGEVVPLLVSLQSNQQILDYKLQNNCSNGLSVSIVNGDKTSSSNFIAVVRVPNGEQPASNCTPGIVDLKNASQDGLTVYRIFYIDKIHPYCILTLPPINNGSCSIELYASPQPAQASQTTNLRVYVSYTDTQDIDSSYMGLIEDSPLYVRVHVESDNVDLGPLTVTSISLNNDNEPPQQSGVDYKNYSTFEYVSQKQLICNGSQYPSTKHWLNIAIQSGGETPLNFTRSIPVKCYPTSPGYTPPTTTPLITTTTVEATTKAETTTPATSVNCTNPRSNLPSMIAGFSAMPFNDPKETRKNFQYSILVWDATLADKSFANYGFITFDTNQQVQGNCSGAEVLLMVDTYKAYTGVANNITNCSPAPKLSDIAQVLVDVIYPNPNIKEGSVFSFLTTGLQVDNGANGENYIVNALRIAVTKRYKLNFFMSVDAYDSSQEANYAFYRTAAMLTDGNFIIMNFSDGSIVNDLMNDLHFKAFSQRLVLSAVFQNSRTIGTIDLTGQNGTVQLFYTVSSVFPNSNNIIEANNAYNWLILNGQGNPIGLPKPGPTNSSNYATNLITDSLELDGGDVYTLILIMTLNSGLKGPILVRIFQQNDPNEQLGFNLAYLDSTKKYNETKPPAIGPSDTIGATARVTLSNVANTNYSTITAEFYNCNGTKQTVFDNYDLTTRLNKDGCTTEFYANPYFCVSNQIGCVAGTENLYSIIFKIQTNSGFKQLHTNFLCPRDQNLTKSDCSNIQPLSDNTCPCDYTNGTYRRGPLCQIDDCSNNGFLKYTDPDYQCQCSGNVGGQYCITGNCTFKNTEGGALDNLYRTLTVAAVFNSPTEKQDVATAITNTLLKLNGSATPVPVWQYQLIVGLSDGYLESVYFGNSLTDIINTTNSILLSKNYSDHYTNNNIDLTPVTEFGLKAIGKEIRGFFWIVSGNSAGIFVDDPNSTLISSFYQTVHGYRQEIYITSKRNETTYDNTTAPGYLGTANAVWSTGGQRFDFDDYDDNNKYKSDWLLQLITHSTSINFFNTNKASGTFYVYTFTSAILLYSSLEDFDLSVDGITPLATYKNGYIQLTDKLNHTITISKDLTTFPYFLSVRAIDDLYGPVYNFVDTLDQDYPEAMPIASGTANVVLYVANNSWTVADTASRNRQSIRNGCTFGFSSIMDDSVKEGLNTYIFNVVDSKNNVNVTKYIPFVAAQTIECKNGGSLIPGRGRCQCQENFEGADCGRPRCVNGLLNSMRNACYCNGVDYFGVTCNQHKVTQ
uniref:EGF-like domain-containing protein n=1 Tax=Acrobeloides nanus TaxID=290746 RepID=A0A914C1T0_9BILA